MIQVMSSEPENKPVLPSLPEPLYENLPLALSPVLIDLEKGAQTTLAAVQQSGGDVLGAFAQLRETLTDFNDYLVEVLPKETLAHRIEVMNDGCALLRAGDLEKTVSQKTLLLVGGRDQLLPSDSEGDRLAQLLPQCTYRKLPEIAHTLLQDPSVDLARVVIEQSFYAPSGGGRNLQGLATFVPPSDEDYRSIREGFLALQRNIHAPVFLSTDGGGAVHRGLAGIPGTGDGRPVLLVGNHQLLAPDLGLLIDEYQQQKGEWLRGLAHPAVFAAADQLSEGGKGRGKGRGKGGGAGGGAFFRRFGALPVSGRTLYAVMDAGQPGLVFPGGVREAYKRKGEQYQLFWPDRPEFVKTAAKFGARIVPFAAVGAEDGAEIVLDNSEVVNLPFGLGESAAKQAARAPKIRAGGESQQLDGELFVAPLVRPGVPDRWYFRFMEPIDSAGVDARDPKAVAGVYEQTKKQVEEGLRYLQRAREEDPYRTAPARAQYGIEKALAQGPAAALSVANAAATGRVAAELIAQADAIPTFPLDQEY